MKVVSSELDHRVFLLQVHLLNYRNRTYGTFKQYQLNQTLNPIRRGPFDYTRKSASSCYSSANYYLCAASIRTSSRLLGCKDRSSAEKKAGMF